MSEVSVVVPSYNHAPYVERALRSIYCQTLQPAKLLVIDDGSQDGSPRKIEGVLRDCPFDSELIVRENRGLCKTLNEGFLASKEKYFAYLGSDDIWLPDFLKKSVHLLEQRDRACLSFGNAYLIDEDEYILDNTGNWFKFSDRELLPDLLKGKIFPSPGVVFRHALLPKRPWNEDSLLEDYDLYLRLAEEHEFALNRETLCAWRLHGTNTSGNLNVMFPEFMRAYDAALERLELSDSERDQMRKRIMFEGAFNLVRHGFKKEAVSCMLGNLSGAESISHVLRLLIRLSIPQTLFKWNRKRKYNKAREKYGKLDLNHGAG